MPKHQFSLFFYFWTFQGYWTGNATPEVAHTRWDSGGARKKNIPAAPVETDLPELGWLSVFLVFQCT